MRPISLSELAYREIAAEDFSKLRDVWGSVQGMSLDEADSPERLAAFLERNSGCSWCAVSAEEIVGTALAGHDGRRGFIYHLAVTPSWRGRGIATELVERCAGALRAAGIGKCHIFVFKINDEGCSFWDRSSWKRREDILVYTRLL
jgi:N-acetylglutamate synthase